MRSSSTTVSRYASTFVAVLMAVIWAVPLLGQSATAIDLPWKRVTLPNGLTLLMQPDSTVGSVAIQVWIRGGAREEVPGQYGIAHLFEHDLPAAGRFFTAENRALRARTTINTGAGTDYDFLRFYADVRPEGLEAMLGAFADRIESDSSKFSEETLRRDQDIVMSEIRRATNIEWDNDVTNHLARGTFGADHPYGHAIAGREADVRAASVGLMQDWHRRFAGASNALVILVGNIDPASAEAMVRRHFGSIRPGLPVPRVARWIPRARERRDVLEKDVPRGVVFLRWPIPGWGDAATVDLELLAQVLDIRGQQLARGNGRALDSMSASVDLMEAAGAFTLQGTVAQGGSADSAEARMRELLLRVLRDGPTPMELARAKAQTTTTFTLNLERLGERNQGRTDAIGLGQYFRNDPERWRALRGRADVVTPSSVRDMGRRWLSEPSYALHVIPRPSGIASAGYDRATTVAPSPARRPAAPRLTERTLASGMRLIVVERPTLPLVQLTLAFGAGSGTDTPANAGRARVALDALTLLSVDARGTPLGTALAELGARTETRLDRDYALLSIAILSDRAAAAVGLLASALARPAPAALLDAATHRAQQRLQLTLATPVMARRRVMGCLLYVPCDTEALDGLGTPSGLANLTPTVLREFYGTHFQPANALLIVSGRVDAASLERQLANSLAGWGTGRSRASLGSRDSLVMAGAGAAAVVDFPSATVTHVLLAQPLPAGFESDPAKLQLARIVNLTFRQRLMANLRESKGWSYEVYPFLVDATRQGAVMFYNIPIQPDKVGEAIREIQGELMRLRDDSLTPGFLSSVAAAAAAASVLRDISSLERLNVDVLELVRSGLSAGAYVESQRALGAMSPAELRRAVRAILDPSRQFWVLAGRSAGVRAELVEAGMAAVEVPPER